MQDTDKEKITAELKKIQSEILEKISAELKKIQLEILETKKEIIFLSKHRRATSALLSELETLLDEERATALALNDPRWAKNILEDIKDE